MKIAYRGKVGCVDPRCTQLSVPKVVSCFGWHCVICDRPSSEQGHPECIQRLETVKEVPNNES